MIMLAEVLSDEGAFEDVRVDTRDHVEYPSLRVVSDAIGRVRYNSEFGGDVALAEREATEWNARRFERLPWLR